MPTMPPILIDSGPPWLSLLFALPAAGAALIALIGDEAPGRGLALTVSLAAFLCALPLLLGFDAVSHAFQFARIHAWIPQLKAGYAVGLDGLSLPLILLVTGLMPLCLLAAWQPVEGSAARMACLLMLESAAVGCLVALDFALLALCWTGLLAPLALLLALDDGGHGFGGLSGAVRAEFRSHAVARFLLAGLAGSLPLMGAAVALAHTGGTFFIPAMTGRDQSLTFQLWMLAAFLFSCGMRLWLPRGLPPAAAMPAFALMPPLGLYGLLRLCPTIAPEACLRCSGPLTALGALCLILGAWRALTDTLADRNGNPATGFTLACAGLAVMGVFSGTRQGLEGAMFAALAQSLTAAGLVRRGGRPGDARIAAPAPDAHRVAGTVLSSVFALAGAALPGSVGFLAVVSILAAILPAGSAPVLAPTVVLAFLALAAASAFWLRNLWLEPKPGFALRDLLIMAPPALALLGLGMAPQGLLNLVRAALDALAHSLAGMP